MRDASRRPYELRRRLTGREVGLAETWYFSIVEDNAEAGIDAYRGLPERYPDAPTTTLSRYWLLAAEGRRAEAYALAEGIARDVPAGGLQHLLALADLAACDMALGHDAEAQRHLADARRNALESDASETYYDGLAQIRFLGALALDRPDAARRVLEASLAGAGTAPCGRPSGSGVRAASMRGPGYRRGA